MASNELSKRSSAPPCPGRNLPLSLTPSVRFNWLSTKSPHVPNTTTTVAIPNHLDRDIMGKKCANASEEASVIIAPPMLPIYDLCGLMEGNSFNGMYFCNKEPQQYAPMSFIQRKTMSASGSSYI